MEMNKLTLEEKQAIKERCKEPNKGRLSGGIATYTCPVCKKDFVISNIRGWVFKRHFYIGRNRATLYFCGYNCSKQYDSIFG